MRRPRLRSGHQNAIVRSLRISPKWGKRPCPNCALVRGLGEGFMLDQDEDAATVIGVTVPHWLLPAINGAAALILIFVI